MEPRRLLDVASKLCELPEIKYVAISTGDHMVMAKLWARDSKGLSCIMSERIAKIEGVKKICPSIILEEFKI